MSKNRKLLIGIGVVGALCLCAALISFFVIREAGTRMKGMVKTDPTSIAAVSEDIAEFDVPPGYELGMAMSFLNYDMVSIMPADSPSSMNIMMMQFTNLSSSELTQEQMQQALEQQGGQKNMSMTVVEQRTETIRGKEVAVTISESSATGSEIRFRQWMTVFEGNKGPVMLTIQGSTADWDEDLVTDFIASIR
ncbi:MAG: hypothetical protein HY865_21750 [Chloroflexi bacterium]|nr:hypothetical protein [Chloroflexota bacterium]